MNNKSAINSLIWKFTTMKQLFSLILILLSINTIIASPDLNLNDIINGEYYQKSYPLLHSSEEGSTYISANKNNTCILRYSYKTGNVVDTLFDVSKAKGVDFKRFDGYEMSNDEKRILIYTDKESIYRRSFNAKYYTLEIRRNLVKPLSEGKQQAATFSPNGRMVAFVKDNNIYLKKLDYDTESAITTDGKKNSIINGVPDWVYEEEFSMNKAMCWSPDNNVLAFIRFNETDVKEYPMQMFNGLYPSLKENELYPGTFSYKYPVSGEKNSDVSVLTFDINSKKTQKINVEVNKEDYIPRVVFTQDPTKLAIMSFNRHQSEFKLHIANPLSGVSKTILKDNNNAYVNSENMDLITFYPEFFTFVSEKSGYRHLYQYSLSGSLIKQLTKGDWDLTDYYGYDSKTKSFYIQGAKKSPLQREVYKIDNKGTLLPVFTEDGTNSANFSSDFNYIQHYYSSVNSPLMITVNDSKGKILRVLEDNKDLKSKLSSINIPNKEFFKFENNNGDVLNGFLIKPLKFDGNKKYPVVMVQYSGPGSQQVLDKWSFDWTRYLASQGYVIACIDGRGTGARGADFERTTYMNLGLKESEDQISAANYLSSLSYINPNNIAIWGWSFGGYNTLMSMTGSNIFKAGIAVAPVTDWKFYDSIYTERYMRTPKENNEGYTKTSALNRAKNLKGNLLIITGSADDNVHPQNTYEFTEILVQNNIDFEMHVYTNRNHFINGGNTSIHLYNKMVNFLNKNLK